MIDLQPSVCIVILNWNGCEVTIDCLKSLNELYYSNFKILVVDNGSKDDSVERIGSLIKDMPKVSMLALDRNYGFTGGNNKGVEYALLSKNFNFFLLLNNDTVVAPDFLLKMVTSAKIDDQTVAVVPKIYYFDNPKMLWYAGGYINRLSCMGEHYGKNKMDGEKYSHAKNITFMNGCAMLIKSETISKLGLFDNDLFANCEDVDLSLRILQARNKIVYEPNAMIWHKVSYSFKSNDNKWFGFYIATRNLVILQIKHNLSKWYFPISFAYFFARWFIYLEIKFLVQGKFSLCEYVFLGFKDGFTKKLRLP